MSLSHPARVLDELKFPAESLDVLEVEDYRWPFPRPIDGPTAGVAPSLVFLASDRVRPAGNHI